MRQLRIIDIFLNALSESNPKLVRFGIAGLCNLCLGKHDYDIETKLHNICCIICNTVLSDAINKTYILRNRGIELVSSLLSSEDEDVLLTVITTLMFLVTSESIEEITSPKIIKRILELSDTSYEHMRVKNMATLFLNDYCKASDLEKAKVED